MSVSWHGTQYKLAAVDNTKSAIDPVLLPKALVYHFRFEHDV